MNKPGKVDTIKQLNLWQEHILDTMPTLTNSVALNSFLTEQQVLATLELAKQIASFHETFRQRKI